MAKEIWYSQAISNRWNEFYKYQKLKNCTAEDYLNWARNVFFKIDIPFTDSDKELQDLTFWYSDYKGEVLHIYFKNKLLRDCLEKIEIKDFSEVKKFLYENGKQEKQFYIDSNLTKDSVVYRFIIHVPYEKQGYAFCFTIFEDNSFEFFFSIKNPKGKNEPPALGVVYENQYKELMESTDEKSILRQNALKLAINTLGFIKCDSAVITKKRPVH